MTTNQRYAVTKRQTTDRLREILACPVEQLTDAVRAAYADAATLRAYHPVNDVSGTDAIAAELWRPIRAAFPDIERRELVVIGGVHDNRDFVCSVSHLQGTFVNDLYGIPASHGVARLRCGEFNEIRDGKIASTHMIIDTLDLMGQAGCWPIGRSLGAEGVWESPATQDGIRLDVVDAERGADAMKIVKDMHVGLMAFDGKSLDSMHHAQYWTEHFMWYGPAGIGTTRGLKGFEANHQVPFLRGFPDRKVSGHIANVGDGNYAVTGGWPSVVATHSGPDWLNLGPTGRHIKMRVMDFYRIDGKQIAENWVPIDIVDIFRQMNVDLFARVRHHNGSPRRSLD
ncbi:MAG: ester cyclase [Pseudomonadota bacterium]